MTINQKIARANRCLKGISIGDAFGESFFGETAVVLEHILAKKIPNTSWEFTDDTVMAIAVYNQLRLNNGIDQNQLAKQFVINHDKDVNRGYGATARRILREIGEGGNWKEISTGVFDGMGSMGNGASMRVGPIGAYYFDDIEQVKEMAIQSAEITHSNIEGITGAIAVAVATALATQLGLKNDRISPNEFINKVIAELPDTDTRSKIKKSTTIPYSYNIETIKSILGNGSNIIVQDTVPFSIWCAAHNLHNFEAALWKAVSILGDRDTICAIVGGITIMSSNDEYVPIEWTKAVENFETSEFIK
jgi:ADP-ribosylglycohydrolase